MSTYFSGTNIESLQDAIITQAELINVTADPTGPVEGRVIESRTEVGRGKVASFLVQRGQALGFLLFY